jgi:hypothetical protein
VTNIQTRSIPAILDKICHYLYHFLGSSSINTQKRQENLKNLPQQLQYRINRHLTTPIKAQMLCAGANHISKGSKRDKNHFLSQQDKNRF